jgi:sigma-B regulation protein RsbU (phosphoserine phosphatase)
MADGKIKGVDERYTAAGEEQWIHTLRAPYRNERGEIIGVVGLFEDITERKRAEELLRLQSAALHAAADAIVITDCAAVIEWVNPAFTRLTGYAAEEALGSNSPSGSRRRIRA